MLRRVAVASGAEAVGRLANLALPFVVFAYHRADSATDSFFLALAIAFFVHGTLANVVVSVLVADWVDTHKARSLRSFVGWAFAPSFIAGGVVFFLNDRWADFYVVVVTVLSVIFSSAAGLLAAPAIALLNIDHRYGLSGITWAFRIYPLGAYVCFSSDATALHWLLAGISISDILRSVILIRAAGNRLTFNFDDFGISFPRQAIPVFVSGAIAGLLPVAARYLSGMTGEGGLSVFEAADRIYSALLSLSTLGVGNVILVYLAKTPNENESWPLMLRFSICWGAIWLFVIFVVALLIPKFGFLIFHRDFHSFIDVRNTLIALSVGVPGFVVVIFLSRRILVFGLGRYLPLIAIWGLAASIFSGWFFSLFLGVSGVGLGFAIGQYFVLILMFLVVRNANTCLS